ncbi:MAG TPA: hypothetical protein PLF88_05340 [Opitutaceae bacterium]|nr:hypothetical protein [Opitutaceae bacterium]HRJ46269.1 hypothetical protein [Opitutaceae bacterium]
MNEPALIKVSFSFYPQDMAVLTDRVASLSAAGLKVREATLLRALIHGISPPEMFAHAVLLAAANARKPGPREETYVAGRPTVDLPTDHVKKLDNVADELAQKEVFLANRAFVVRAILRASPSGKELAPLVREFLEAYPYKPRGVSKLRLERKASSGGPS